MMHCSPNLKGNSPNRSWVLQAWWYRLALSFCLILIGWQGHFSAIAQAQRPQATNAVSNPQSTASSSAKRLYHFGDLYMLPNAQAGPALNKPVHGIKLTVDTRWNSDAGYHPVRIQVDRVSPSQSDTTITIQFSQENRHGVLGSSDRQHGYTVLQVIDLPANANHAEVTVSVPYFQNFNAGILWEVYVDGSLAEELSSGYSTYEALPEFLGIPRILFVEDALTYHIALDLLSSEHPQKPDLDLETLLDEGPQQYWSRQSDTNLSFMELPISRFPSRARDYSNLDIIYLSQSQFQDLRKDTKTWRAIHQWVAAGGNVWITGVDLQKDLAEIELAFQLASEAEESAGQGWHFVQKEEEEAFNAFANVLIEKVQQSKTVSNQRSGSNTNQQTPSPKYKLPQIPEMQWRAVMMGQVRVFSAERPFEVQDDLLAVGNPVVRFPYNSLIEPRDCWQHRHGISLQRGNSGFWNWLIPSVGLPPVTLFQILIALFVIGIGPVNYILLRRARRLQLLLVTVPVAALLITACIFAYSLWSDGLSTRLRTRSYTEIDQTSGLAVAWSRHSYYSGLAPDGGMTFPNETIVYPIRPAYNTYQYPQDDEGFYEIQYSGQQYLTGDWLPSRVPKQYLTIRAVETKALLHVQEENAKCEIRNGLNTHLQQLIVIGTDGKFYWGEQIADGASITLTEVSLATAVSKLNVLVQSETLEYPAELERMNKYSYYAGGLPPGNLSVAELEVSTEISLLEKSIERITQGNTLSPNSPFAPDRYIAIGNGSPLGDTGVVDVVEQGSLHVISARWK